MTENSKVKEARESINFKIKRTTLQLFTSNQVESIIVTEVTVKSPFITLFSQNPQNFLDKETIMVKKEMIGVDVSKIKLDKGYVCQSVIFGSLTLSNG